MNIDFETMAVLEEESQNESGSQPTGGGGGSEGGVVGSLGAVGSVGADSGGGGGGRRGRRPGRKQQSDKQDMKAKLERSRQSARECRARKKLRYQYLEELVTDRERAVLTLRKEIDKYYKWNVELDQGRVPEGLETLLDEMGANHAAVTGTGEDNMKGF